MNDFYVSHAETAVGQFTVIADNNAVTHLLFGRHHQLTQNDITVKAVTELNEYFAGNRTRFTIPLSPSGTDFQKLVWQQLLKIQWGKTISYGEIAKALNKPGGARAVGMANNKNPIPIFIPCHRVIASNGHLQGYAGGLKMKSDLLKLENHQLNQSLSS